MREICAFFPCEIGGMSLLLRFYAPEWLAIVPLAARLAPDPLGEVLHGGGRPPGREQHGQHK